MNVGISLVIQLLLSAVYFFKNTSTASVSNRVLMININDSEQLSNSDFPLKMFSFCVNCPHPDSEGSVAFGLLPKHSSSSITVLMGDKHNSAPSSSSSSFLSSVTAEAVYCVPNLANQPRILNAHELMGRVAIVNRGDNGLLEKVLKVQAEGAAGVIIIDDGQCNNYIDPAIVSSSNSFSSIDSGNNAMNPVTSNGSKFLYCGFRTGGFSASDDARLWAAVDIPVLLITKETGRLLDNLMTIEMAQIPRMKDIQKITVLPSRNEEL